MIGLKQSLFPPLPTPLRRPVPPPPAPNPQSAKFSHHFSREHALSVCAPILYVHHLPRIQRFAILTQHGIALAADTRVVDTMVGEFDCWLEYYYARPRG